MFGRKTKKAKAITAQQTAQPKAYQVWYRNSVGMWVHGSTHTNITDARS